MFQPECLSRQFCYPAAGPATVRTLIMYADPGQSLYHIWSISVSADGVLHFCELTRNCRKTHCTARLGCCRQIWLTLQTPHEDPNNLTWNLLDSASKPENDFWLLRKIQIQIDFEWIWNRMRDYEYEKLIDMKSKLFWIVSCALRNSLRHGSVCLFVSLLPFFKIYCCFKIMVFKS